MLNLQPFHSSSHSYCTYFRNIILIMPYKNVNLYLNTFSVELQNIKAINTHSVFYFEVIYVAVCFGNLNIFIGESCVCVCWISPIIVTICQKKLYISSNLKATIFHHLFNSNSTKNYTKLLSCY